jgi:cytochrome c oxidase subunit 2
MKSKKITVVLLALALTLALAACGAKENTAAEPETDGANTEVSGNVVTIEAKNFEFGQQEYKVKKGETVKFVLDSKGNHGIKVEALGVNLDSKNKSQEVTLNDAGTYEIVCSIMCGGGHGNMKAKLIVE